MTMLLPLQKLSLEIKGEKKVALHESQVLEETSRDHKEFNPLLKQLPYNRSHKSYKLNGSKQEYYILKGLLQGNIQINEKAALCLSSKKLKQY